MKTKNFRLTLDVEINSNKKDIKNITFNLYKVINDAVNNGTITAHSSATLESYSTDVVEILSKQRGERGEHLWHEHDGVTKCVTCFCDQDDAFVGGLECSYKQKPGWKVE